MKNKKIYNVFFPIWFLLLFPITWIIAIPLNFVIDSIVILLSLKFLRIEETFQKYKKVILKVFLCGFFSDFIGAIFLFLMSTLVVMGEEQSAFFKWVNDNIINSIMENPFNNLYAFILMTIAILISGLCIYYLNLKLSFKNVDLEEKDKKKLALYMAIFTAPYLFYIPASIVNKFLYNY